MSIKLQLYETAREAKSMADRIEREDRMFTDVEQSRFDALVEKWKDLKRNSDAADLRELEIKLLEYEILEGGRL